MCDYLVSNSYAVETIIYVRKCIDIKTLHVQLISICLRFLNKCGTNCECDTSNVGKIE